MQRLFKFVLFLSFFSAAAPARAKNKKFRLAILGGYRANVLLQDSSPQKSFFEFLGLGARVEARLGSLNRFYVQYFNSNQVAVATDSLSTGFWDNDFSLGFKQFLGGDRAFILMAGNYLVAKQLSPSTAYGISAGGGLEFPLSERFLFGLTVQYTIVPSGVIRRRSFLQSADLSFAF